MSNKIIYRKEKGSQLTSAEVDSNFKYLDQRIDKASQKDYFIHDAGYSKNDQQITVNRGSKWLIGGEEISNAVAFDFVITAAAKNQFRVDVIVATSQGQFKLIKGTESEGYVVPRVGDGLDYLYINVSSAGIQSIGSNASGDYVSKLSYSWVQVDVKTSSIPVSVNACNIEIVGGNFIIDQVANGIFKLVASADFPDGYEVAIKNSRSSYLTIVNSAQLKIYTGRDYTVRPGEIIVFKYDRLSNSFSVSGGLDIRLDIENVDEIIGTDTMRMFIDSSAGDALNPNDLNTTLTPTILKYFKDYNHQAVGWQWKRYSGNSVEAQKADVEWAKGKTKRVLMLTSADFTDAILRENVSFICEAVVNSQVVTGVWVGKLVDQAKTIRIQNTGTQFKGLKPEYIMLKAIINNFTAAKIEWFKDGKLVNVAESFLVYANQVDSFSVYELKVTDVAGNLYQDAITISKVVDGKDGADGKAGAVPVWTEWMTGDKHYNNDKEVYYIYHRPTETVWKLKDGQDGVIAPANPDSRYVRQPHLEQVVTRVLVAEGANIAGFIFKDGKMVSQYPSVNNPNLILDGTTGKIIAKDADITGKITIGPGSPAFDQVEKIADNKAKDIVNNLEFGGRNLILNSRTNDGVLINNERSTLSLSEQLEEGVFTISFDIMYPREILPGYNHADGWVGIQTPGNWSDTNLIHRVTCRNIESDRDKWVHHSSTFKGKVTELPHSVWLYSMAVVLSDTYKPDFRFYIRNLKIEKGNTESSWSPAPEDLEAQIKDNEVYVEYSINGTEGWHFPMLSSDNYSRQRKGNGPWSIAARITGVQGKPGVDGKDGVQGPKGSDGINGAPGKPGIDGKTPYVHTAYANSADGRVGFSLSDSKDKAFWGNYTDFTEANSTDPSKYTWVKVRGEGITSKTPPPNPYEGMLWVDTSKTPSEQKVYTGGKWVVVGLGIDDIKLGGRNLLLYSKNKARDTGFIIYEITERIKGDYVLTLDCSEITDPKGAGISFSGPNGGSDYFLFPVLNNGKKSYYLKNLNSGNNKHLSIWVNSYTRINTIQLEEGNIPSAWSPAQEEVNAELINLKKTTDKLSAKTDYLSTTIDGNVVTTGTVQVGDANGNAKAGMTGTRGSKSTERVVVYAGSTFADRESAPIQIWDSGLLVAKSANVEGVVKANAGYFGGFQIQANTLQSTNDVLVLNANDGSINIVKPSTKRTAIRLGLDKNNEPSIEFFDDNGNVSWSHKQSGIVYINRIPESYERYGGFNKVSSNTNEPYSESWFDAHLNGLTKDRGTTQALPDDKWFKDTHVNTAVIIKEEMFLYNAGKNEESANNEQYEGFVYRSKNKLGAKVPNGWYVQSDRRTYTYTNAEANLLPNGEIEYLPPKTRQEFNLTFFKVINGKVISAGQVHRSAVINITQPFSENGVKVDYTKQ